MNEPDDAEFEKDRVAFDAAMEKVEALGDADETPDRRETIAAIDYIANFAIKHRKRLEASGFDVDAFLDGLPEQTKVMDEALAHEDKALEAHLGALAHRAEAFATLTEREYQVLRYLDKLTQAEWDAMPPEDAQQLRTAMEAVRAEMPESLASLPIERRRKLEELE
jgi:hypothetical protein